MTLPAPPTTTHDQPAPPAAAAQPPRPRADNGRSLAAPAPVPSARPRRSLSERAEAYISKLSTKNNFWHRACSLVWLPFAFRSGIKMKRLDPTTFTAILPFRRFNRNWYNAMAGAALLGNSEIAGGMYVFGVCGGDYTVVCKHLEYRFLRPCLGPAVYRITPRGDIAAELAHRGEFNIVIDLDIFQGIAKLGGSAGSSTPGGKPEREKRVGKCEATFHVTPKLHHKSKRERVKREVGTGVPATAAPTPDPGTPPPT